MRTMLPESGAELAGFSPGGGTRPSPATFQVGLNSDKFNFGQTWRLGLLSCVVMAAVSGCGLRHWAHNGFLLGPNYCKPEEPVASQWIDYADPQIKSDPIDLSTWWTVFNDPKLDTLIATAAEQNLSLRAAGWRIMQARAIRGIAAGNLFPQEQQARGGFNRTKLSEQNVGGPPPEVWFSEWETGFNATWEIDFWGRFRRAIDAADAELDASIANYDDVQVLLLSDVAASYVQVRIFQERLDFARENVEIQKGMLAIAEDRFKNGATTERDVHQAKTVLEETQALIPRLETGLRQANNQLCVLLGSPPRDLIQEQLAAGKIPASPPEVAVGIPADLVRRRPDIRRAERELAAQSERIGIAETDLYPHFSLNGVIAVQAEDFTNLFRTPASVFATVGPAFRWDILNYGRLQNAIRFQDARFQELAFAYQNQVLTAGREAEDAIVGYLRSQQEARSLEAAVQAANRTVEIARDQYVQGAVDFTAVFLFEQTLTAEQDQLAIARGNVALNLIRIYRSLGGGWQIHQTQ